MKAVHVVVTLASLLLSACVGMTSLQPEEKETLQQVYQQEFERFVTQAYHRQQKGSHIFMSDDKNSPVLFARMVESINSRLRQNGMSLTVTPYSHENRDKALCRRVSAAFPQIFNPLHHEVTPARDYMGEGLAFAGATLQDSGFYAGDSNKNYYEKYYVAGTLLHIPGLEVEEALRWQVLSVRIPYAAKNKNLRQAEIAARNWDFEEAEKRYALAKNASGRDKVRAIIDREAAILPRYRHLVARQNASAEYWAKKREAERSSVNWTGVMIGGLNSFSNTMQETGRILAESHMNTAIATQSGYNTQRIHSLEERLSGTQERGEAAGTSALSARESSGSGNSAAAPSFVSDSAYRLHVNTLKRMGRAYVECYALYRIKANLSDLYEEKEKGRGWRQTIDHAITVAEREYRSRKEAFDRLQSDRGHMDAVKAYTDAHPETLESVLLSGKNTGRDEEAITRRYQKLQKEYGYFVNLQKNLYQ